jgi:cellulose synthase/poly-beta-1,6-N-acetylglucosamine synthase-like glycosyltransferase
MNSNTILEWAFWCSGAIILYSYVGFPLLVALRALVSKRFRASESYTPHVSIVIAAHNEVQDIGHKLERLLESDYPRDRLEIIVASDGSTDGTDELIDRYESACVRTLHLARRGKAATLNSAVSLAQGEILIFSDANSLFARDTIHRIVAPFAVWEVGGVAGNQVYEKGNQGAATGAGEHAYWNFDRWLKTAQCRCGNVTSATGALYAIRRELFVAVPEGVTDDFVTSTRVIAQGRRLVFAPNAVAYEPVATSSDVEFGRKVRVITRGLRGVWTMRELLNPWKHGFYSIQLFSHKVLRRLVVVPLIVLLISSILLMHDGLVYQLAAGGQIAFYGAALLGACFERIGIRRFRLFSIPIYFCVVNLAALFAIANCLRGHRIVYWEPARQASSA